MSDSETKVEARLGVTLNLKNFENIRIDVGVQTPRREGESMVDAMERVYRFVESELEKRVLETKDEMKKIING